MNKIPPHMHPQSVSPLQVIINNQVRQESSTDTEMLFEDNEYMLFEDGAFMMYEG